MNKKFLVILCILLMVFLLVLSLVIDDKKDNVIIDELMDYSLVEKLYNTERIVVKDSNDEVLRELTNYRVIYELVRIIKDSKKIGNDFNCDGYLYSLDMYDENGKLIDTIYVWNDRLMPRSLDNNKCEYYTVSLDKVSFIDLINDEIVRRDFDRFDELDEVTLSIKEGTLSRSGTTVIIKYEKNLEFNYISRIDRYENDKWVELEMFNYDFGFNSYELVKDNEYKIDWKKVYGKLENGKYRLISRFYNKDDNNYYYVPLYFVIE